MWKSERKKTKIKPTNDTKEKNRSRNTILQASKKANFKMEYSMRDLETAIAMNANSVVNVQQKKQFDLADVDHNEMKLEVIPNRL